MDLFANQWPRGARFLDSVYFTRRNLGMGLARFPTLSSTSPFCAVCFRCYGHVHSLREFEQLGPTKLLIAPPPGADQVTNYYTKSIGTVMAIVDARLGSGSNLRPMKPSWYMVKGALRWVFPLTRAPMFPLSQLN